MLMLGFDHALAQWCTTGRKRRGGSAAEAEARKAARIVDAAEQAARDAANKRRQAAASAALQLRAAKPLDVLTDFRKRSGLKSADLDAIKDDECVGLDPSKYFLKNNGGESILRMAGGAVEDSAWRTLDDKPVTDMANVDAPDRSTPATRGGYYLDSRWDILKFDVEGYLTKVESPGIDLFAYMWMYKGDGVFYRELVEAVPGGGHRRVKIRAGNWMVPMDAAAETELRHRMCYFYYEPV